MVSPQATAWAVKTGTEGAEDLLRELRQGLYDKTAGFALRSDPGFRERVNGITMKQ